jgi:hypothetical protein
VSGKSKRRARERDCRRADCAALRGELALLRGDPLRRALAASRREGAFWSARAGRLRVEKALADSQRERQSARAERSEGLHERCAAMLDGAEDELFEVLAEARQLRARVEWLEGVLRAADEARVGMLFGDAEAESLLDFYLFTSVAGLSA